MNSAVKIKAYSVKLSCGIKKHHVVITKVSSFQVKKYFVSLSASGEARSESKQILQRILYQLFLYFAIQLQDGQSNHLF